MNSKEIHNVFLASKKIPTDGLVFYFHTDKNEQFKSKNHIAVVTKKTVGNAVKRNLIRRRVKEIFRQSGLQNNLYINVIVQPMIKDISYGFLQTQIQTALNKWNKIG
ncbi:MAG: ribonuclease P protein component [Bifidobacteriaceae bacterium]|jgi:ribonuclease P protein component|nr:ribonuclease P protein component [Bifidobacteriaceae bacterium]